MYILLSLRSAGRPRGLDGVRASPCTAKDLTVSVLTVVNYTGVPVCGRVVGLVVTVVVVEAMVADASMLSDCCHPATVLLWLLLLLLLSLLMCG